MELIELLKEPSVWEGFVQYKTEQNNMHRKELKALQKFVAERRYEAVVEDITSSMSLSTPVLSEVNKHGTGRKRNVFVFPEEENFVLKLLAYLLRKYDSLFEDNLFSFRANRGVKKGIYSILKHVDMAHAFTYKADVHDYFISIDPDQLIALLKETMPEEPLFIQLFEHVLNDPYAIQGNQPVRVRKGAMPGMPVSGFFANLYLSELDRYFAKQNIPYLRYSDDIVVFAETEEQRTAYEAVISDILRQKGLEFNPAKVIRTAPGEPIEFLGFEFQGKEIDISDVTLKKLKAKLYRKAHKLYRWKKRTRQPDEQAVSAYIHFLNRKFYEHSSREITWARWYFPLLTKDGKLKVIDQYAALCMRYLISGHYRKTNYRLRYKTIQKLGYRSLVNSYWRFQNGEPLNREDDSEQSSDHPQTAEQTETALPE
ncbi:MAG: hypothetical protein IKS32_04055 [Solobacterium sp.]|nr:hypothetical protein [Solobacterium sp.]